jgi:hypothetical protein
MSCVLRLTSEQENRNVAGVFGKYRVCDVCYDLAKLLFDIKKRTYFFFRS